MPSEAVNHDPPPRGPLAPLSREHADPAGFPRRLLVDHVPKDGIEAVYRDVVRGAATGRELVRQLTISAEAAATESAAADDDEIILALLRLTEWKVDPTGHKVRFTRRELADVLGWDLARLGDRRLRAALRRWLSVYLEYRFGWSDQFPRHSVIVGFHVIEAYKLHRCEDEHREPPPSSITWNGIIAESFDVGYLKPLDRGISERPAVRPRRRPV